MKRSYSPRVHRAPLLATLGSAFVLGQAIPTWAQATASATAPAAPSTSVPAPAFSSPTSANVQAVGPNFKLQSGDVLAVQVANHPEMSSATVAVAANGKLNLPIVGALTAAGRTLGEVTTQITRAYATQLKRPQVAVTLVSSIPRQLIVRGTVGRPGPLDVRNDLRLSEVIANVGGLMVNGLPVQPDEVDATLVRPNAAPRVLDLDTALSLPQSPANLVLRAGDIVNIQAHPVVSVTVAGTGVTPSVVNLRPSKTLPQVRVRDVLRAANSLHGTADKTQGTLLRNNKITQLDLPAVFDGSQPDANIVIQNGDLLTFNTIETKKINVTVASLDNSVKMPGNYTFEDNASVMRTLFQAQGFAEGVKPDQVSVSVLRDGRNIPVNIQQAALDPTKDLSLQDRDIVNVAFTSTPRVSLLGTVSKPDNYRLKNNATLLDAISAAQGLTLPPAQTSIRIFRTQPDGKQISINVDANRLFTMTDLSQNVRLQDGDEIFASQYGGQAYIGGEVTTPGPYTLGAGEGLTELLLKSGGVKPTAALSKVSITSRNGSQRVIDASAVNAGAKVDVPLQEGDVVNVPLNPAKVTVLGAVTKPDNYPIPENGTLTLGNALLAAGGPVQHARLQEVAVVHRLPDNTTKTEIVSVNAVQKGVLTIDYPLQNGDVIWVPENKVTQSGLSKLSQSLGILGLITRF